MLCPLGALLATALAATPVGRDSDLARGIRATSESRPTGKVPIVFLPGTGGSALRFGDNGDRFWLDDRALDPAHLLLGRLGDLSSRAMAPGEVLDVVTVRGLGDLRAAASGLAR